jgi:hypothetical protein
MAQQEIPTCRWGIISESIWLIMLTRSLWEPILTDHISNGLDIVLVCR